MRVRVLPTTVRGNRRASPVSSAVPDEAISPPPQRRGAEKRSLPADTPRFLILRISTNLGSSEGAQPCESSIGALHRKGNPSMAARSPHHGRQRPIHSIASLLAWDQGQDRRVSSILRQWLAQCVAPAGTIASPHS